MYHVTTNTRNFTVDAIEYITAEGGAYCPVEPDRADGFKAMTIQYISDTIETYSVEVFVLPDHTLLGEEEVGTVEYIDEPDPPEFSAEEFMEMLEEIL
jgi:hypothetical protein